MIDICSLCAYFFLGFVAFVILVKIYNHVTTNYYKGKERLDGKTTIVTGSNAGCGELTAKDFARRGARVVMVCRDMAKAERVKSRIIAATNNTNISLKHVDFLKLDSVRKCANEILAEEKRIDILVNNAGAGGMDFGTTPDGLEILFQCNYYGPFLFTNILLGRIIESAPSRIVNVSSATHYIGEIDFNQMKKTQRTSKFKLYADTKLANIIFSNELARKLNGKGVTSNSLHPGIFKSEINRHMKGFLIRSWEVVKILFFHTIEQGTQTNLYVSLSPELENVTGKYFSNCMIKEPAKPAEDLALAKKLWEFSEEVVNLKPNEKHY